MNTSISVLIVPIFGYKGAFQSMYGRLIAALHKAGHAVCVVSPRRSRETMPFSHCHQRRIIQICKELEELDTFLGMKTRIRQLRNFHNLTLYENGATIGSHVRWTVFMSATLFSYAGIRLARALGVPHILEVERATSLRTGKNAQQSSCQTERRIMRGTDAVIVVSRRLQEFVASCGVSESRIHILPVVDPQRFATANNGAAMYTVATRREVRIGLSAASNPGTALKRCVQGTPRTPIAPHTHSVIGDGPEYETLGEYIRSKILKR